MKSYRSAAVLFLIFLFLVPAPVFAATMRCGTKIVSTGASMAEVATVCGQPAFNYKGRRSGTEQWTYNMGSEDFMYTLTFRQGKLERVDISGDIRR